MKPDCRDTRAEAFTVALVTFCFGTWLAGAYLSKTGQGGLGLPADRFGQSLAIAQTWLVASVCGRAWHSVATVALATLLTPLPIWVLIWKAALLPETILGGMLATLVLWSLAIVALSAALGRVLPPAPSAPVLAMTKTCLAITSFMVIMVSWQWLGR